MDWIIAKTKGKKKQFKKLMADNSLFDDVNIENLNIIKYEPDHNLDEESWFKIENFNTNDFCIDLLKTTFNDKELFFIDKANFKEINLICSIQKNNFYFQKITPSLYVTRKTLSFGEIVKIENGNNKFFINKEADAIFFKECNTLIFKNLASISSIFKGIDMLYKEATKDEVNMFLDQPFISLDKGFKESSVSKPNRKRISLAINTLNEMTEGDRSIILSYIDDYCDETVKFNKEKGCFTISSDDELKYLLYGIEQRFYTTLLGKEKRLANSIQKWKS